MTDGVCFVDCETTGLDPDRHDIWELAIIVERGHDAGEYVFRPEPSLYTADPMGLKIGRFYERTTGDWQWDHQREPTVNHALKIARLLDGRHIVGAVPSFDAAFLTRHLRLRGQAPTWHYHLIDVEALAVGYLRGRAKGIALTALSVPQANKLADLTGDHVPDISSFEGALDAARDLAPPPWTSEDLSRAVGVDADKFDRHTALGDARWAKAIYEAVMGTPITGAL